MRCMKKKTVLAYYKTPAAIASALKITRQAVHQWPETVPFGYAYVIDVLTHGQVPLGLHHYPRLHRLLK